MAEIKEKIKKTWRAITLPDGVDEEYDKKCDDAFYKTVDHFINACYTILFLFSIISVYFFITRELL